MSFKEIPVEECGINPFADLSKYCIVTAGNKEKCNSMLVTWGSFGVMWRKPTATIYIRQSRFTKTILDSQDYYTLSVLPVSYKPKESYMGSHSGRDGDKFEGSGLTPCFIGDEAAAVEEADLILVCRRFTRMKCLLNSTRTRKHTSAGMKADRPATTTAFSWEKS